MKRKPLVPFGNHVIMVTVKYDMLKCWLKNVSATVPWREIGCYAPAKIFKENHSQFKNEHSSVFSKINAAKNYF